MKLNMIFIGVAMALASQAPVAYASTAINNVTTVAIPTHFAYALNDNGDHVAKYDPICKQEFGKFLEKEWFISIPSPTVANSKYIGTLTSNDIFGKDVSYAAPLVLGMDQGGGLTMWDLELSSKTIGALSSVLYAVTVIGNMDALVFNSSVNEIKCALSKSGPGSVLAQLKAKFN
jgi:hypothetical protein